MEDLKTEAIVVGGTNKVQFSHPKPTIQLTNHQTSTIQLEAQPNVVKTIKQQIEEVKEGAKDTRPIKLINPYASYFPEFYKKELRNAFIGFLVWTIISILTLSAIGIAIYFTIESSLSNSGKYVDLLMTPVLVLVISLWIVAIIKYYSFRGEAKIINFKDEKTLSVNVLKLYKRLKTGYIDVNWFSLTSYLVFGLVILINFIVAKAMYTNVPFGTWDVNSVGSNIRGTYLVFEIIFWVSASALLLTLILQAVLLLSNHLRATRIENFYNFMIVPQEEITALKKQKNRRDLIIFLCSIALVGLIGFFIYKLVKRNKATVVVS